jgi:hypothetical protein
MDHEPRIHRQRLSLLLTVALAGALCFVPLGKVPLVGTLREILLARKVVVVLCGLVILMTLVGRWRTKLWSPFRICGYSFTLAVVAFCIFRVVVLSHRSLPTFAEDDPRAAPYYQQACDGGRMDGCAALGACYWTGTCGLTKNVQQGVDLFQRACSGGDMSACGQLGACFEVGGCGLTKSGERAVAYYVKACDGGEMGMCNNLGVCYFKGECGLGKDDVQAAKLYRKACRGGDSGACHNLDLIKN